jgi:uncharacterized protein YndB with AHSA1/START domain
MDRVVHSIAELRCQPAEAYSYFISNQHLQQWLTNVAEVEATVGGKYELFWDPADRENDSTIGCRVTALGPGHLLAFEWRSPKQFKHFANSSDPLTHVVVAFMPTATGTTVHLVHSGWRSSPEWLEAAAWQERAWGVAFQDLQEKINGPSDA